MGMINDGLSCWQAETEGISLLEMTIGDLLDRRADELALQEAVVYSCSPEFDGAHEVRWTYQEYRERANQVACGLMALGLNKGDHIAVWATNLPEWLLLEMAAAKTGLVLVTVNPAYRLKWFPGHAGGTCARSGAGTPEHSIPSASLHQTPD